MKVYVGIPAYNASKTIVKVIRDVFKNKFVHKIILVDDASKDNTYNIVKKFRNVILLQHKKNRGYGGAQKTIYSEFVRISQPEDIIVMIHSDGQTLASEIPRFVKAYNKNPGVGMVLGSRALGNMRRGGMPIIRIWGDWGLTQIQNFGFGMKLSTFASGYRSFKNWTLKKLDYNKCSDIHSFDTEILVDAHEKGIRMVEVPVSTVYKGEKSHYSLIRYSLTVASEAIMYRIRKIFGLKKKKPGNKKKN